MNNGQSVNSLLDMHLNQAVVSNQDIEGHFALFFRVSNFGHDSK